MRTVAIYIGSRANYSSALPLMRAIKKNQNLNLKIYLAGAAVLPRFGDLRGQLAVDGFNVDVSTNTLVEGETPASMAKSIGLSLIEATSALEQIKPDIAIAIGDRFDVLPWVLAAVSLNIYVAHTMGGERSGTIDESIRHAITKFSHIHFPANLDAANRIIKMGEDPEYVFPVGCPRIDYVAMKLNSLKNGERLSSEEFYKIYSGVGVKVNIDEEFILCLFHPVTTEYGKNKDQIIAILETFNKLEKKVIMIWPNADAGSDEISKEIRKFRETYNPSWLYLFVNLPLEPFVQLMSECACMVGNSSSAIREAEYIGTPVVNIGTRQSMRLRGGNVIDVEVNVDAIYSAIIAQIKQGKHKTQNLYGDGNSCHKIAKILAEIQMPIIQKINNY